MKLFKKNPENKYNTIMYRNILMLILIIVLIVVSIYYIVPISVAFYWLINILYPFLVGIAIAYLINLPMNFIETRVFKKNFKAKRGISLLITLIIISIIIYLIIILVVPQIIDSVIAFKDKLPSMIEYVLRKMHDINFLAPYADKLQSRFNDADVSYAFEKVLQFLKYGNINPIKNVVSVFSGIFSLVLNTVISIVFAIYILTSKNKIYIGCKKLLYANIPENISDKVYYFIKTLDNSFKGFIKGQFIDVCILGILCLVGMEIFKFPYPVMISVLMAFLALIPLIGAFIGCGLGFLIILIDSPSKAIFFLIYILIILQLDSKFIYPKVVGKNIGLPEMFTLLAIVLGASMGGIVGMWLAIPFLSAMYAVIKTYTKYKLYKKQIDIESKPDYTFLKFEEENNISNDKTPIND